ILKITKMEVLQMGILSVVPPLIAIFLAIVTRRVIISLFISIWVGGIIYNGVDPFFGLGLMFSMLMDVMNSVWNSLILLYTDLYLCCRNYLYWRGSFFRSRLHVYLDEGCYD